MGSKKAIIIRFFALMLFAILFFATRLPRLYDDTINPDGVNWHYRSEQFIVALKTTHFENTYQHYHPGVTLMWISGVPIELFKHFYTTESYYNQYNFQFFDFIAKYFVVVSQLMLSIIAIYLLSKVMDNRPFVFSLLAVSIFTFEPFFIGNSRLYHMDVLLALFMFIGLMFSYLNVIKPSLLLGFLSGAFLSLTFLTKSIGIGGIVFAIIFGNLYLLLSKSGYKAVIRYTLSTVLPFLIVLFILFPALWKQPIFVLSDIFLEGERIGIRDGHGQILFGEYTRDAGVSFYPLVILLKTSLVTLIGLLAFIFVSIKGFIGFNVKTRIKQIWNNPIFYLGIFYLGYFFVMSIPSKKVDRYMIPVYPFFGLICLYGYFYIKDKFSKLAFGLLSAAVVLFSFVLPIFNLFPYYFTYTNPIFGSPVQANNIIAQKPFGIGIYDLKTHLSSTLGLNQKIGFIDTKPMKSIYSNSKIFDIREAGVSRYDYLILGINEEMPEKVLESKTKFQQIDSFYINGLEFWRIYEKTVK